MERTFILIKPDAVERSIMGEIITRFEKVGLKIIAMKMKWTDADFAKKHYSEHTKKDFYPGLEAFITSGPVIAMVLEGISAISLVRKLCGPTEPHQAAPGTIRGDYSHHSYKYTDAKKMAIKNIIHASGNKEDADKEIKLWFADEEIHSYQTVHEKHVF